VTKETDGGIKIDACYQAAENIYVAGDIARFSDWRSGEFIRIEHWRTAEQHGRDAALNMAGKKTANTNVPFFWTRQGDVVIRYVGHVQNWDEIIFDGDVASGSFIAYYIKKNQIYAAAGCRRDNQMAAIHVLMRLGKMPAPSRIRENPIDPLKLIVS
jgi:NADPH-dependent 2,4-dienoyl-CoA reductase/sulfur reductase-like enzyme